MATKKSAAKKPAAKGKSSSASGAGIPEPIARQLLKLLSTDDGFRRRYAKDHVAGLLEAAGVSPAAHKCCRVKKLAAKKDIAAAHDDILEVLTKCLDLQPVKLDTGR